VSKGWGAWNQALAAIVRGSSGRLCTVSHRSVAPVELPGTNRPPNDVAIAPSGKQANVIALDWLHVCNVASQRQVAIVPGLGPHGPWPFRLTGRCRM
jgi:hypothetical protein